MEPTSSGSCERSDSCSRVVGRDHREFTVAKLHTAVWRALLRAIVTARDFPQQTAENPRLVVFRRKDTLTTIAA
jgi:hypothetical protein